MDYPIVEIPDAPHFDLIGLKFGGMDRSVVWRQEELMDHNKSYLHISQ